MKLKKIFFPPDFTYFCTCSQEKNPDKQIPEFLLKFPAGSFAYPIGEKEYVTEKNDWRDL